MNQMPGGGPGHPSRVLRSWVAHLQPAAAVAAAAVAAAGRAVAAAGGGGDADGFAVQNRAAPVGRVPGVGNPQNTAPLGFHPCTNQNPAALTSQQVAEYNSAGFLTGIPLLSSTETAELRGYCEGALASIGAQGVVQERDAKPPQRLDDGSIVHFAPQYTIASVHLRSARVWDLMRHPKLVALVTDILGPNVVGWGAHLFDAVYWPIHPSQGVEVWLALDDVDSGNSCMRFVRGSHQLGALAFETSNEEEKNVLNLTAEVRIFPGQSFSCSLSHDILRALIRLCYHWLCYQMLNIMGRSWTMSSMLGISPCTIRCFCTARSLMHRHVGGWGLPCATLHAASLLSWTAWTGSTKEQWWRGKTKVSAGRMSHAPRLIEQCLLIALTTISTIVIRPSGPCPCLCSRHHCLHPSVLLRRM
jgi:hypothetical protein